jgi:hypothetical protein
LYKYGSEEVAVVENDIHPCNLSIKTSMLLVEVMQKKLLRLNTGRCRSR